MATIHDIAKLSGYSIGTVSRVINNHPDVSQKARKIIQEVIERENYQPNSNAKNMKLKSSNIVAILVKGYANMFFAELVEQLQHMLDGSGQEVSIHYLDENADEVEAAYTLFLEKKPKGIIFLGGGLEKFDTVFANIDIPCVLLTNTAKDLRNPQISSFSTDNELAAASAIQYLVDQNHKHIGIIGGNHESRITKHRLLGAVSQMKKCNITFQDDMYEPSRFSLDGGYTAASHLLKRHPEITAIFALGDTIALGALRSLCDLGYEVPKDISLIGFDGIELGQYCIPRLSTIHQDTEQMARKAVEDLLLRINFSRKGVHEVVPFQIINGATVTFMKK